ncbi:MAG: ABC transporter ATP-binding protein [Clostridiaceae bacterium]|jgi:iron complex transport system ATP-binding protein|nr:ABC transporter ATP-binding protein [Clostridiaceae bacterium]
MIKLQVENLGFSIAGQQIISGINLIINKGDFVGLVGPNGCGKSTLLKNIYRAYKPDLGAVFIDGTDIFKLPSKEAAKKLSVVVQENNVEFDMDVLEMVMLGRFAHQKLLSSSTEDHRVAREALLAVGLEGYEARSFASLSGGEKQRVLIARALAQQANFIVLDEPTNHLDVGYQYQIMSIVKKQNTTVFCSIHDLNIAAYYCDKIIVMNQGTIIGYGPPKEILTTQLIDDLFGISTDIIINETTGKMQILFNPYL